MLRTSTSIINGISSAVAAEASAVALGDGQVIDLKFVDQESLLILCRSKGNWTIPSLAVTREMNLTAHPNQTKRCGYSGSRTDLMI